MTDLEKNPLMNIKFELPFEDLSVEHIVPAITALIERADAEMAGLEKNIGPGWDALMGRLQEIWSPLWEAWGMVGHLNAVKNSESLRTAYEQVLPSVVEASLRCRQSRVVYDAMVALRESDDFETLGPARQRVLEKSIQQAELEGVGLDADERKRYNEIASRISKLTTDFDNHVLDAIKTFELIITDAADVEGWPSNFRSLASGSYNEKYPEKAGTAESGPWRVTLDGPSSGQFLKHSRDRAQREQIYLALVTRASEGELDNTELVVELLRLRAEQARLLGFESFAELSLASKMAPDVPAVRAMADELEAASRPAAEKDLQELQSFARQQGAADDLNHWDFAFWIERLSEERFGYTEEEIRPYFPLDRVLDGVFGLCEKLFGIRFQEDTQRVQTWDPDVRYYRVLDRDGAEISSFYLDPYSRPAEKNGGAWMNTGLQRKWVGDQIRKPIIYLVCNSTPPAGPMPSLMSFNEVVILFHEFGHGLHGLLTEVEEPGVAGNWGIEWDAVELPSQFMENWCYHRDTLKGITRHYETGAPMPDELIDKLLATREFRAGSAMLAQISFLSVDIDLYHDYDPAGGETPLDLQQRVFERLSVVPPHPRNRFLCSFTHIFTGSYAAGYYSYKWAEILSADAFAAFEEAGLDNEEAVRQIGMRFRETVLAQGGSVHPSELYRMFRGRDPRTDALLRHKGLIEKP